MSAANAGALSGTAEERKNSGKNSEPHDGFSLQVRAQQYPTQAQMAPTESLAWQAILLLARPEATDTPGFDAYAEGIQELRDTLHEFVDALVAGGAGRERQQRRTRRGHASAIHAPLRKAQDCACEIWDRVMDAYCVPAGGKFANSPRLFALYEPTLTARLEHMHQSDRQRVISAATMELERLDDESERAKLGDRQFGHYSRALQLVRYLAHEVEPRTSRN